MRRTLIALLVTSAVAACGGPPKPTTPPPTLPDDKKPEVATPVAEKRRSRHRRRRIRIRSTFRSRIGKATYKLASAGKGQKAVIKIGAPQGAKQQLELAVDFAGKQIAPTELGGTQEDVAPTLVLASDLEVAAADADGIEVEGHVHRRRRARSRGSKVDQGAVQDRARRARGRAAVRCGVARRASCRTCRCTSPKPNARTMAALELIRISMMPMWPIVPTEAIGVGAKWTVTTPYIDRRSDRSDADDRLRARLAQGHGLGAEGQVQARRQGPDDQGHQVRQDRRLRRRRRDADRRHVRAAIGDEVDE